MKQKTWTMDKLTRSNRRLKNTPNSSCTYILLSTPGTFSRKDYSDPLLLQSLFQAISLIVKGLLSLLTEWKPKRIFTFAKKRWKQCSALVLQQQRKRTLWATRVAPPRSFPWNHTQPSQHQAAKALSCGCEHLFCSLIYFVHPLARCIVKYQKSL